MSDLFLSYARKDDEDFVRRLYDRLTAEGLTVWFDREAMPNRGLTFSENIKRAVLDSKRLVLIVGPEALKSEYVTKEWRTAYENCLPVIPLMRKHIHPADPDQDFAALPKELCHKDAVDFRSDADFEDKFTYLLRQLEDKPARLGKPVNVPRLTNIYVQRKRHWQALNTVLRADDTSDRVFQLEDQLAALYGIGGLGKSTLATAFMLDCDVRRSFPDGLIWVYLGPDLKTQDIPLRQADIAAVFGDDRQAYIDPQAGKTRLSLLLQDKDALIILDDLWDYRHADYFFALGPQCRMLITSRRRDVLEKTRALKDSHIIQLDALTPAEALELIAKETKTEGEANPHEADQRTIIKLLGGHTLAVTLTAAHLKKRGLDYTPRLLARLQKANATDTPFKVLRLDDADKNLNVAISMELSYNDLESDRLRERLRRLGVLPPNSGFSLELAAALWEESDEDEAEDDLFRLLDAVLIDRIPGSDRCKLHPIIQAYAAALLRREGEYEAACLRYADVVIEWADDFYDLPPEDWAHLDAEADHFLAVGDMLVQQFPLSPRSGRERGPGGEGYRQRGRDFAYNITRYLTMRREVQRPQWLDMGLTLAREDDDQKRERLFLNQLGLLWSDLGEKHRALEYYEQKLVLDQSFGDQSGEATTLNNIGKVWSDLGEEQKALEFYEKALSLHQTVGDRGDEAAVLNNIGMVWFALGEKQKALDYFEQVLAFDRELDNRSGEAVTLNNIGGVWSDLGEKQKALEYYEQALPLYRAVGDRGGEATVLNNLCLVYRQLGDNEKALSFYEKALPLLQVVGDRYHEALMLNNIGDMWNDLGDKHKALDYYERALSLKQAVGDRSGEAVTLTNIGRVWDDLGEKRKALAYYEQALPLRRAVGDRSGEAVTCYNMGSVYYNLGDLDQAIAYLERCVTLEEQIEHPDLESDRQTLARLKSKRDGDDT